MQTDTLFIINLNKLSRINMDKEFTPILLNIPYY